MNSFFTPIHKNETMAPADNAHMPVQHDDSSTCLRVRIKLDNYMRSPKDTIVSEKGSWMESAPHDTHVVSCIMCGEFFFLHFRPQPPVPYLERHLMRSLVDDRIVPTLCIGCEDQSQKRADIPNEPSWVLQSDLRNWAAKMFSTGAQINWSDRFPGSSKTEDLKNEKMVFRRRHLYNIIKDFFDTMLSQIDVCLPSWAAGRDSTKKAVGAKASVEETFLTVPPPLRKSPSTEAPQEPRQARQPPGNQQQKSEQAAQLAKAKDPPKPVRAQQPQAKQQPKPCQAAQGANANKQTKPVQVRKSTTGGCSIL